MKLTELPIADRYSTGSSLTKANIKNVFVVGDALGGLMLAHNASYQAHQIMNKIYHMYFYLLNIQLYPHI